MNADDILANARTPYFTRCDVMRERFVWVLVGHSPPLPLQVHLQIHLQIAGSPHTPSALISPLS